MRKILEFLLLIESVGLFLFNFCMYKYLIFVLFYFWIFGDYVVMWVGDGSQARIWMLVGFGLSLVEIV